MSFEFAKRGPVPPTKSRPVEARRLNIKKFREQRILYHTGKKVKQSLCVSLLEQGYAQTYVDLFYVTHGEFQDAARCEKHLFYVKTKLIAAESSLGTGTYLSSYQMYSEVGDLYENSEVYGAAEYFYSKAAELAHRYLGINEKINSCLKLASCSESLGKIESSIKALEQGVNCHTTVNEKLENLYQIRASELESIGKTEESIHYNLKLLSITKDPALKSQILFKLGTHHFAANSPSLSQNYLEQSLVFPHSQKQRIETLLLLSALQGPEHSVRHLKEAHSLAIAHSFATLANQAYSKLEALYQQTGQIVDVTALHKHHFSTAKQTGAPSLIDPARVRIGLTQAEQSWVGFTSSLTSHISKHLKNNN